MKIAVVFVPQWDPRQPPLAPEVLAGTARNHGLDAKVWDLNLALYQKLVASSEPESVKSLYFLKNSREMRSAPRARPRGMRDANFLPWMALCREAQDGRERLLCIPKGGACPPLLKSYKSFLLKKFLDPACLSDITLFQGISDQLQIGFFHEYDPKHSLYWDALRTPFSPNRSEHWQKVLGDPTSQPFLVHIETEISRLLESKPDWILVSVISDTQIFSALGLAKLLRQRLFTGRIIFGGDAFSYRKSILKFHPWLFEVVDGIAVGDGEPVVAAIANGASVHEIPNLFSLSSQEVVSSQNVRFDFSRPVPRFEIEGYRQYLCPEIVVPVETARGCPWSHCAFCIHPNKSTPTSVYYCEKPLSQVFQEIEFAYSQGFRFFFFVDEAILPGRLSAIAGGIMERGLDIRWICYSRLVSAHSRDTLERAKKAGCRKIFFGLESGSDKILNRFKKGISAHSAFEVLRLAGEVGIGVHLFLMTGFPGETEEDQNATCRLLKRIIPFHEKFSFTFDLFSLSIERETELFADPEKFGLIFEAAQDMGYQYQPKRSSSGAASALGFLERLNDVFREGFGPGQCLHDLKLSQDSLHLLLMEFREKFNS